MSRNASTEAFSKVLEWLTQDTLPSSLKDHALSEMQVRGPKRALLDSPIATAEDDTKPNGQRRAAITVVVNILRGE